MRGDFTLGAEAPSFREALADGVKAVPFKAQRFKPRQADTGVVKKAEVVNLVPAHEPCRSTEATPPCFLLFSSRPLIVFRQDRQCDRIHRGRIVTQLDV